MHCIASVRQVGAKCGLQVAALQPSYYDAYRGRLHAAPVIDKIARYCGRGQVKLVAGCFF